MNSKNKVRKFLFLITEDWFFYSHFLPFLEEATKISHEVVVVTHLRSCEELLKEKGCRLINIQTSRGSLNPFTLMLVLIRIISVFKAEKPDVVHCITLPMVLLGGIALRITRLRKAVFAPVGLGHLWISNGWIERQIRISIKWVVSSFLRQEGALFLFENDEDPSLLGFRPDDDDIILIGGAGVDSSKFYPMPEPPSPPIKIAVVSRMTLAKGIPESLAATKLAKNLGAPIELHLFGGTDYENPGGLLREEILRLCKKNTATWHGPTSDVASVWRDHHIALLLSHREGLPKSLIEAIACGRPVIATDVPGCRTVIRHNIEGLLVPVGDINTTANALLSLSKNYNLRQRFGAAGIERFQKFFTLEAVRNVIKKTYSKLLV